VAATDILIIPANASRQTTTVGSPVPGPTGQESQDGQRTGTDPAGRSDWYASAKVVIDYAAAAVLLVLTFPVLLAAVVLTRVASRGPALYRQTRVGRNGREFTIHKIRSMYVDCERHT
jgi:lipopolysaccharide/colanic/teichoic acid biosynthesis glycosyltransferase